MSRAQLIARDDDPLLYAATRARDVWRIHDADGAPIGYAWRDPDAPRWLCAHRPDGLVMGAADLSAAISRLGSRTWGR